MKKIIGIDVGGTKCAVLLAEVTDTINIIDKIKFPSETEKGFTYTKDKIFEAINDILRQNKTEIKDVNAIGVSCGGPLNSKEGIVLCPPNLPGWENIHFVKMLEDAFSVPAFLQNDAKACALVEWKIGAGVGSKNMMFLTMGTGMGSGIIANSQLQLGASDMFGEIGHIRIENDGPIGFGKAGSFEGFCSGGGIAKMAIEMAAKALGAGKPFDFAKTNDEIEALTTEIIANAAKKGDKDAINIFNIVGEKLGKGLAYLIDILNPEVIVIGSIFVRCESLLRPTMEEVLKKECISFSLNAVKVVTAKTGESVGDLASIMVAAVGIGYDFDKKINDIENVLAHYNKLFERYPELAGEKENIWKAYELIKKAFAEGRKLLCCGNGGSASDSEHVISELMKGFRLQRRVKIENAGLDDSDYNYIQDHLQGVLRAISLTGHTSLSSAYINDVAPDMVYAQQLYGYGDKNDVLLAISTSGNSKNVVRAVQTAKLKGMVTVGLTGPKDSKLSESCDVTISAAAQSAAEIQELHLPIYHTLCSMLEACFFEN